MGRNAHQVAKRLGIVLQPRGSLLPPKPNHLETLTLKCRRLDVLWTGPVSKARAEWTG